MKSSGLCLGLAIVLPVAAWAGSEQIIKQRAKDIRDQNNTKQGVPPPASSTHPAGPQPQAVILAPTPEQASTKRLSAAIEPIIAGANVTPEQRQKLNSDIMAAVPAPTKPSKESVTRLSDELIRGLIAKPVSGSQRERLVANLVSSLGNAAKLSPSQLDAAASDMQAIFHSAGLPNPDAGKISDALRSVVGEAQKGK